MQPILTHPTWADIQKGVGYIATKMVSAGGRPQHIIGLCRGGLIPAVMISHMLEIPVVPVSYSSKEGEGENQSYDNCLPGLGDVDSQILIIDDICDSGKTMDEVQDAYSSRGHHVLTAALYYKETSVWCPEFKWQIIPADSPWVIFPWEM